MANTFTDDDIDFGQYMQSTDSAHKVRPASEYAHEVEKYFHSSDESTQIGMPWRKTWDKIAFRSGEVTVWAGYSGHGKSLILGQISNHLMRQFGQRLCIASMEMKPYMTLARMCRQAAGGIPDVEYIHRYHRGTNGLLWVYDQQGTVKGDKMAAVIRYCHEKHDMQHFVIDSLLKCGFAEDDYTGQKMFVDQLCSIGRDTGVHIHLIHHSRKGADEYKVPNKHDIKGTGSITDQVDNVIVVWRNKLKEKEIQENNMSKSNDPDCLLAIEKQRNGEWEGRIALWFDSISRGFRE